MEGDAWEMEDHRNWLDASFKTYVRPLALPYPYTLKAGSSVTQTVTLTFSGIAARGDAGGLPIARSRSRSGAPSDDAHARDRPARPAAMDGSRPSTCPS